ncbi:hypothetical protein UMZ34_07730 [Halopseudomonas pachastrellae]|nr:hypothetical protein UMZ34_07730 [Halopseudomonas pachastrellae]
MHNNNTGKTLLVLGGSGLVGMEIRARRWPIRRSPRRSAHASSAAHGSQPLCHLDNPQVDFDNLPEDAHWWHCDAALCALGTTRKHAASREAFRLVDRGYVSTCARLARRAGTRTFVLNSAVGASPRSGSFYLRVKGEVEQDLSAMDFVP